jgi:hypothetical protein
MKSAPDRHLLSRHVLHTPRMGQVILKIHNYDFTNFSLVIFFNQSGSRSGSAVHMHIYVVMIKINQTKNYSGFAALPSLDNLFKNSFTIFLFKSSKQFQCGAILMCKVS